MDSTNTISSRTRNRVAAAAGSPRFTADYRFGHRPQPVLRKRSTSTHSPPTPPTGTSQDLLQRRRLQPQPLRRPSNWHPLYQDRPLQQRLFRRHQHHRHCPFRSPSSNPMTTPTSSPASSTTSAKPGRENNEQSPCAAPPSASCRWTSLPPRQTTSSISPPRPGAHNVRTSSLLPPKTSCTVPTTKPLSSSNDHPQPRPEATYHHPPPLPHASKCQC